MPQFPDPVVVVLVGAAGSGKSHWAATHSAANQIVSSDRLRAAVGRGESDLEASADAFALLDTIAANRIGRRLTTVIDTLGFDDDLRRRVLDMAQENRVPCHVVVVHTSALALPRLRRQRKLQVSTPSG